jgi:hypothetical protein
LYHLVPPWIKSITLKSWIIWERGWCESKWKLQTIGSIELHYNNAPAHSVVSSWICGGKVHFRASEGSSFSRYFTFLFFSCSKN